MLIHANSITVGMHDNSIIISTINILEKIKNILQILHMVTRPASSYHDKYIKLLFLFFSCEMLNNLVAFGDCVFGDQLIHHCDVFILHSSNMKEVSNIIHHFSFAEVLPQDVSARVLYFNKEILFFFFFFFQSRTLNRPQIHINQVFYPLILIKAFKCWVCANPNGHTNTLSQNPGLH